MAGLESTINNIALIAFCMAIIIVLVGCAVFWLKLMLYRLILKKTVDDYLPEETRKQLIDKLVDKTKGEK